MHGKMKHKSNFSVNKTVQIYQRYNFNKNFYTSLFFLRKKILLCNYQNAITFLHAHPLVATCKPPGLSTSRLGNPCRKQLCFGGKKAYICCVANEGVDGHSVPRRKQHSLEDPLKQSWHQSPV